MHAIILTNAILVPRARRFLVTGSLQIKPSGSVDENERMLGTYMQRMRNNHLEITIAGILVSRASILLVSGGGSIDRSIPAADQKDRSSGNENGLRAPLDARNDCFVSPEAYFPDFVQIDKLCENYQ